MPLSGAPAPGRAIIISTGRCGSTLLSDLLAEQVDTLSVQEFLMSVSFRSVRRREVLDGAEYWAMLASPKPEIATLFRLGLPPKEIRYPATGRYAADLTALPRILAITLSKLTADPDSMFDRLAERVRAFPRQDVSRHHQMFLDTLTVHTGRRRWVERSGGSSHLAPYLLRSFPTARFVHLTRNWEDTARSMSRHASFQLLQLRVESIGRYGLDPFAAEPGQAIPAELEPYLPDQLTPAALRERGNDIRRYLALCAFLTNQADQAIADARPQHLHTMRYEELVADPVTELGRLGQFLEFEDWTDWADQMAERVARPAPVAAGATD